MAWAQFDEFTTVKVKQESRHVLVVLHRPNKSNALDDTMWNEIPKVKSDNSVRKYCGLHELTQWISRCLKH